MTTVRALYEALEGLLEDEGGSEVLIATQPNWPFENFVAEVRQVEFVEDHPFEPDQDGPGDCYETCAVCGEHAEADDHQMKRQVYIVDGGQKGYLPGEAKKELGW
jgi:hypothetical protein